MEDTGKIVRRVYSYLLEMMTAEAKRGTLPFAILVASIRFAAVAACNTDMNREEILKFYEQHVSDVLDQLAKTKPRYRVNFGEDDV